MKNLIALLLFVAALGLRAQVVNQPGGSSGTGAVSSVSGTANQVACSPTTGIVVCGLASNTALPGAPTAAKPASNANSTQLATTNWVQQKLAALNPAVAVTAATVAVLPDAPTYSNGSSGVGATLTATTAAALVVDGVTLTLNQRLLVNNQATAAQNGVYALSTLGTGAVDYILTRATDFNTVSGINNAGVIPVTSGTVNNSTTWALDTAIATIGTSAINYDQTNAQPPVITNVNGVACTAGASPGCTANWVAAAPTTLHVAQFDGTNGELQDGGAMPVSPTTNQNIRTIGTTFGDMTSTATALSASAQACVEVPFSGTIQRVILAAYPSGSATVDVRTVALASWTGPASTSTITASDIPALSSATLYTDSTLTGWTTTVTADSWFCFYLTSPSTVTGLQIELKVAAN